MNEQKLAAFGPTILRLTLGVMFLAHAGLKIFVFTIPGTVGFFSSLGLPAIAAYLTIAAEALGGILLIAGWRTRIVATLLLPVLLGATWVHSGNGWLFTSPNGGWEYPLFMVLSCAAQALLGAGAASLDQRHAAA